MQKWDMLRELNSFFVENNIAEKVCDEIDSIRGSYPEFQGLDQFLLLMCDLDELPHRLPTIFKRFSSIESALCPFTPGNLARAASLAFGGQGTSLPEHRRNGRLRMLAHIMNESEVLWKTCAGDLAALEESDISDIVAWQAWTAHETWNDMYLLDEAKEYCGGEVSTACLARCDLSASPEIIKEYGYEWNEVCEAYRWAAESEALAACRTARKVGTDKTWESPYWSGKWCISLYLFPWPQKSRIGDGVETPFRMFLDGTFTEESRQHAMTALHRFVPAVLQNLTDGAVSTERPPTERFSFESLLEQINEVDPKAKSSSKNSDLFFFPSAAYVYDEETKRWFDDCLNICLANECQRSEYDSIIYNGLLFIEEARKAEHHGIAVGYAFAAIESMLTERSDRLNDIIKQYATTLLQPDPNKRTKKVKNAIEKLYGRRSDVFHGRSLSGAKHERRDSLRLAVGVLRAVCNFRAHLRKAGKEIEKEDLRLELEICTRRGQSLVGVPDLSDLLPIP